MAPKFKQFFQQKFRDSREFRANYGNGGDGGDHRPDGGPGGARQGPGYGAKSNHSTASTMSNVDTAAQQQQAIQRMLSDTEFAICPQCKKNKLKVKYARANGNIFISCTGFP